MELHQLECLIAVVETGSFRAASEKLHKAQSAVSLAIKNLEVQLGFQIFDRSTYRPQLTPQGRSYIPHVKALLTQQQRLTDYGAFLSKGYESKIRIGVTSIWNQSKLVPIIQNFVLQFPFTEIILYHETLSADELLEKEKIDLAISEVFNEKQLFEIISLDAVRMLSVCLNTHPLAKFKGTATRAELTKHRQVVLKSTVPESTRVAGVEPGQPQIGVQDFAMKKELILHGVGWGAIPLWMMEMEVKKKKLVQTHRHLLDVPIFLAWSKKRVLGPCANFLISALTTKKMKS